jgi:hypothetical protein
MLEYDRAADGQPPVSREALMAGPGEGTGAGSAAGAGAGPSSAMVVAGGGDGDEAGPSGASEGAAGKEVRRRVWCVLGEGMGLPPQIHTCRPPSYTNTHAHTHTHAQIVAVGTRQSQIDLIECEHVSAGAVAFAHCMCRNCFMEYLDVSGGIYTVGSSGTRSGGNLKEGEWRGMVGAKGEVGVAGPAVSAV